jgi:hypothetical protein
MVVVDGSRIPSTIAKLGTQNSTTILIDNDQFDINQLVPLNSLSQNLPFLQTTHDDDDFIR